MLRLLGYPTTIFLLLLTSLPSSSSATNSLRSGDTLNHNGTLVSSDGTFEFGFFATASNHSYLGIWYHNITPQVVVWIANRDAPFANSSAQIKLADDGNLVVLHGGWNTTWSTDLKSSWSGNFTATLEDNGDLVIKGDETQTERWRSFDHPTDTLLPGMRIYIDKNTGEGLNFRSWRAAGDPSSGNYTLGLDRRLAQQLVTLDEGGRIRWRSGLWIGDGFNGVTRMRPLFQYGFHLAPDGNQANRINFDFTYINNTRMRFVLLPNGTETTYVYDNSEWKNIWQQPVTDCEFYNHCGENAVCDESLEPKCGCLFGFEPRSTAEWDAGNWTRGCGRRTPLKATRNESGGGESDGFEVVEHVKFPDAAEWDSVATEANGCAANCAGNASCTAYAYDSRAGCFRWTGELADMMRFADGSNGGELWVRLAGSELAGKENKAKKLVLIIVPTAAGVLLLLISIFLVCKYKSNVKGIWKKQGRVETAATEAMTSDEQHYEYTINISDADDIHSFHSIHSERKPFELPMFSFELLELATDNFSEANGLGRGGFGNVYKGRLPYGEEIAVKRLSKTSGQGHEEFKNEMTLIAKLQHVNLVRLLGCCIQGEEKMLIYEYMPNKSLDAFIFDPELRPMLNWTTRFHIIEGIARGLVYLHRDSRLRIIHRDLKASNILLDQEMNPKISDFGMARIFLSNQNHDNTNRVVGTFGYMSPEYAMDGIFSIKSDVYSFGVLLLEIITGIKNTKFRTEEYQNLLGYAWKLWDDEQALELVDHSMRNSCNLDEVLRCIHVALLCVQDHVNDRPTMSTVMIMLGTETKILAKPRRPTFSTGGSTSNLEMKDGFSRNDMTVTDLNAR